jgi:hypothetical protein
MFGRRALGFALGLALPVTAAMAQPPAPDPAALDLARLLMARDETLYDDSDLNRFQARIENSLLASEGACNAFVPACRSAATAVAREFAPVVRRAERARSERITAFLLADSLRPDEMVRIAQYVRSDEGGRFLAALALLRQGDRTERRRELERSLARTDADWLAAARARFRQNTRNLPGAPPR